MTKISKQYIELANEYGFTLVRSNKHLIFKHKNGRILACPSSPSDSRRGLMNLKRDIKRTLNRYNMVLRPGDRAKGGVERSRSSQG
jgi:hypothetical protein